MVFDVRVVQAPAAQYFPTKKVICIFDVDSFTVDMHPHPLCIMLPSLLCE